MPLVAAFLDDAAHDTEHILTGTAALTYTDAADILTRLTGHTVRHRSVSEEKVASRIAAHGVPAAFVTVLAAMDVAIADGDEDRVTDTVERIAGRPARSFSTFENKGNPMKQLLFHDDVQFWFETLRVIGHASYGGADFGEVVATASQITAGDYDSWHDAWLATAERVEAEARAAHPVSARDGFLRASTYYRSAEFFLHGNPDDPRIEHAFTRGVACFRSAIAHLAAVEPVEIPYGETTLSGYFYRASGERPKPTLVMHNGFDGSAEELHFFGAVGGQERGYHVLTFDGPGQATAIHRDKLPFRPDWENVVGPVLDFLLTDPTVDPARIALLGLSLGGMLAPRAAAFETRLAAVVAVDGVYDGSTAITTFLELDRVEISRRANADHDEELDELIAAARDDSPVIRWAYDHGRYAMGVQTDRQFLAALLKYNVMDGIAEQITCPVLVCEAAEDLFFAGDESREAEPRRLYEHLTAPKKLLTFTATEGAAEHCHSGAQRLAVGRIFDWLDDTMPPRPEHYSWHPPKAASWPAAN